MDAAPALATPPAPVRSGEAALRAPTAGQALPVHSLAAEPVAARAPSAEAVLSDAPPADVRSPETLHPMLWLGSQLGRQGADTLPSGFAALNAQLPGGGWPRRVLSELLLRHPGVGEIRLLAPALVATQRAGRLVMLFDPPAALSAAALQQLGFDVEQLLIIHTRARVIPGSDSLWALEQALKSGHVGAIVAWLPARLRAEHLRRLQIAAHAHDGPAFVLREMAAEARPTASPLRLALRPGGADRLELRILKRRGPPLETPLQLALAPVLSAAARQRARVPDALALRAATFVNLA
ncbi:translesion DNA synthesis-associated protein ImuA [Piscinibacter koreensis]|uniref:Translesion DNA synthesis-associated protein ImuA n=1 Tax=Piscinibacter koreensis TaxID=2742824 RepID=A0A7Y6NPY2_9BURK|nr:translesion DNA synthesis-associated protein ImuA [Schlegelella koreensis]NUZ07213.1 translesion DNA synthesis-associated protein ImuA [Schlegelella koreensis]